MAEANFAYDTPASPASLPLSIALYSDRLSLRSEIAEDARSMGLRVSHCRATSELLEAPARPHSAIVLLDCPRMDAKSLAAIAALDMHAAATGICLIVLTGMDSLDAVFGVLDQSDARILANATRGERVIALGDALAKFTSMGVRESQTEDHLMLLRLTEQVAEISRRLERFGGKSAGDSAFRFNSPEDEFRGSDKEDDGGRLRKIRPSLPDPRLVRRILRERQSRARFFGEGLFADPAWDMLLDLTAARAEHKRVSVTSLCIASGVPPTTALRWIGQLTEAGLFERVEDDADKRRVFIQLSDAAADAMARYFAELDEVAERLV